MSKKTLADHHPHYANHRHGGINVGQNHARKGPQPGQVEFTPGQEQAMRDGAGDAAPVSGPNALPGAAGPAGGDNDGDED